MTGLAFKIHGIGVFTGEDHLFHIIEVFTLDGKDISGEDRLGCDGLHLDGLGVGKVGEGSELATVLDIEDDLAHLGAFQGNNNLQGVQFGTLGELDKFSDLDVAGEIHGAHLVQVPAIDAEGTAAHNRVGGHSAKCEISTHRVHIHLFLLATGEGHQCGAEGDDDRILKYLFHMRF